MRPMAAAAVGALISGVAMYAVSGRAQDSGVAEMPALVQTVDGQYIQVPGAKPLGYVNGLQPASVVVSQPAQTVYRPAPLRTVQTAPARTPQRERVVVEAADRDERSWAKTAMIIGGSAGAGAAVGGIVGGKKGALIGAAAGGGAASIYEATRRR